MQNRTHSAGCFSPPEERTSCDVPHRKHSQTAESRVEGRVEAFIAREGVVEKGSAVAAWLTENDR